jgi:hypothetical protein
LYRPPGEKSDGLRQGDLIRVTGLFFPDVRLQGSDLVDAIKAGKKVPLPSGEFRSEIHIILSQCCDLGDRRILTAPLLPVRPRRGRFDSQVKLPGIGSIPTVFSEEFFVKKIKNVNVIIEIIPDESAKTK